MLAVPASRSTLLRLIRALPEPVRPPRVRVDEFALRKGHVLATVLVDIETRRRWICCPTERLGRWQVADDIPV